MKTSQVIDILRVEQAAIEEDKETTPPVRYKQCIPSHHEAAIETEGYCPCYDGIDIYWEATTGEMPNYLSESR